MKELKDKTQIYLCNNNKNESCKAPFIKLKALNKKNKCFDSPSNSVNMDKHTLSSVEHLNTGFLTTIDVKIVGDSLPCVLTRISCLLGGFCKTS